MNILFGKPKGKRPFGIPKCRWDNDIKKVKQSHYRP
jgi:hypothetical protein